MRGCDANRSKTSWESFLGFEAVEKFLSPSSFEDKHSTLKRGNGKRARNFFLLLLPTVKLKPPSPLKQVCFPKNYTSSLI